MIMNDQDTNSFNDKEGGGKDYTCQRVLNAIVKARKAYRDWQDDCDTIDDTYSLLTTQMTATGVSFRDAKFDLFWSSFEILKPAVYARAPVPAVKPMFSDGDPLYNTTAELLERASISTFARTNIDDVMQEVRDDILFTGRGIMWPCYLDDKEGQRIEIEHVDRKDFIHDVARKWCEVGWVAKRSWLSRKELKERFKVSDEDLEAIPCTGSDEGYSRDNLIEGVDPNFGKTGVWEVWHKADDRVYWVVEGYDKLLDESEPHLKLSGFFPCPKPAYGTLQRRSLVPVPDYLRFVDHFRKISELTSRIYTLLDSVKMKGFFPGGGEIGEAIESSLRAEDDKVMIPVSTMGEINVVWLPLDQVVAAINSLIESRSQLIEDYYQLSGISDIMRGATQAQETLGAQQLKSQFGSVRVQQKIQELQRIAADMCKIVSEIEAEHFSKETLLKSAQMQLKTKKDIEKEIKELEGFAEEEMKALTQQAEQMIQQAQMEAQQSGQPVDPAVQQQAQERFETQQQEIMARYGAKLQAAEQQVPIDAVMELLRDDRARSFSFEVESDSTILTDEMREKQSRAEFLGVVSNAIPQLTELAKQGESAALLAGEFMKFAIAPYRAGRSLQTAVDDYIEKIPEMATLAGEEDQDDGLAEAQKALADAEMAKAQAATMQAEAKFQRDQAEMQLKMQQMQLDQQEREIRAQIEIGKLEQAAQMDQMKIQQLQAQIDLAKAQTMKALSDAQVSVDNQALDQFKSLADIELRTANEARSAEQQMTDNAFRANNDARNAELSDRQQNLAERNSQLPPV